MWECEEDKEVMETPYEYEMHITMHPKHHPLVVAKEWG